jgi:uncharacterized membrane protein
MGKNYFNFKNSITSLLIISFIVMPFYGIPKKAEAQSLGAYTAGLVPAIAQLPLCRGKLTGPTKYLFGEASEAIAIATKTAQEEAKKAKALAEERSEAASQLDAIGTYDAEANKKLRKLDTKIEEVKKSTASIDANDSCIKSIGRLVIKMLLQKITLSTVAWINSGFDGKPAFIQDPSKFFNDIAKNEVLQFRLEINNPELFPFGEIWLRNQAAHFNNKFADNARYSLDELIKNTTPQYSANAFWLDFDQGGWGAWSAMTQYPGNNALGFQLMASSELQRRLEGTTQSTAQNVREALQAADGFLGDQRCVDPKGVTREEHDAAIAGTGRGAMPKPEDYPITLAGNAQYNRALTRWNSTPDAKVCNRWEYVTPGKLIAEAATSTIKYPENNLLKADDLNDAMAAILDALMSKFSNDLMQKGYANLGNEGSDGIFTYAQDSFSGDNSSQTEKDFRPVQLASSWLSANPNFNIRTDLTQALIDEQRTYILKLEDQNKELNSTTDGKDYKMNSQWTFCANEDGTCSFSGQKQVRYGIYGSYHFKTATNSIKCDNDNFDFDPNPKITKSCEYSSLTPAPNDGVSNAYGLIPAIAQLDYCIPGPHPGWEEDSRRVLDAVTNVIIPETEQSVANKTKEQLVGAAQSVATTAGPLGGAIIGASMGSVIPVVGTVIGAAVGAVAGFVISKIIGFFGSDNNAEKVRSYYSNIIHGLTGVHSWFSHISNDPNTNNIQGKQGVVQSLNVLLERYVDLIHMVYNEKVMPSITRDAASEFNKLKGYAQIIENNKDKISLMNSVVATLNEIKTNVDKLNTQLTNGTIKDENENIVPADKQQEQYEINLGPQINAFGRVSANMINGDDIASADNLLKQIIDEKNYVYKDLLKGPLGCEQELQNNNHLSNQINQTARMDYPFPILYTYDLPIGGDIPDPWPQISGLTPGHANKTNRNTTIKYGPGFLGFYKFQIDQDKLTACAANENGEVPQCELKTSDVLPKPENITRSLGASSGGIGGPFESSIGVY